METTPHTHYGFECTVPTCGIGSHGRRWTPEQDAELETATIKDYARLATKWGRSVDAVYYRQRRLTGGSTVRKRS